MTYARVLMSDMSGWDKLLYLDLDIIVTGDIGELYDTDLGDNYVGSCFYSNGINGGVMLINGLLWRKDKLQEKTLNYASEYQPKDADQTSVQEICKDRIKSLDQKWNLIVDPIWGRGTLKEDYYSKASITHYITGFKPWNLGYWMLSKGLRKRWKDYRMMGGFPFSIKKETTVFVYQLFILFKIFILKKK